MLICCGCQTNFILSLGGSFLFSKNFLPTPSLTGGLVMPIRRTKRKRMQIYDLHPLVIYIGQYLFILCLQANIIPFKDYTSGLSLISFGLRGYCLGVLPVFLMYRIARLSSKVGRVTVRTSSSLAFSVLSALLDSPTSSS